MLKNFIFYAVAGSIIAYFAQAAGANLGLTLLLSMVLPPAILLTIKIIRYNGMG